MMVRDYLWENICISCPPLKAPKSGGQLSSFQGESLSQGSGFRWDALLLLLSWTRLGPPANPSPCNAKHPHHHTGPGKI